MNKRNFNFEFKNKGMKFYTLIGKFNSGCGKFNHVAIKINVLQL